MLDDYWDRYDECLNKIRDDGNTVGDVIRILNECYAPSSGEAFFPGGADRDLLGVLIGERDDWSLAWAEADYYYIVSDSNGDRLEYCEGDVSRVTGEADQ